MHLAFNAECQARKLININLFLSLSYKGIHYPVTALAVWYFVALSLVSVEMVTIIFLVHIFSIAL